MKTITFLLAGLVGLSASPVSAQDGPQLTVGILTPQGDAGVMTQRHIGGYAFQFAYAFSPEGYMCTIRPNVGWGKMPGKSDVPGRTPASVWGPNSYDLGFWNAGVDFVFKPFDATQLKVLTGPSAHLWQVNRIGATSPRMGDQSWRAGWRVGCEYPVAPLANVGISYTLTEWTSNRGAAHTWPGYVNETKTPTAIDGVNPSKPAYVSLYVNYRF
jgi:hypothetical protein